MALGVRRQFERSTGSSSEREALKLGIYTRNLLQRSLVQTRNVTKTSRSNIGQTIITIHDEEMERHLKGVATDEYVEPVVQQQLPERTQVQEVMCDFSEDLTTEDIVRRRIRAINRMVALCSRREVPRPKQRLPTFHQDPIKEESLGPESPDPELFPLVCAKTQCPICIGNERLTYSSRTFCYKRPSHMMAHLQKMPPGQ
jgi:hypothetical protein